MIPGLDQYPPAPVQSRYKYWRTGSAVFLAVAIIGYSLLHMQGVRARDQQRIELLAYGSSLRERVSHELGSALHLTGGLHSYLSVRRNDLQKSEVDLILGHLYTQSRHARNFAVAVGYRVTYIYPLKGNEKALGLNYPDVASQWPDVKRVVDSGMPFLVGPLDLVQGGKGVIYRVPVIIDGGYWGLLSTVVDFNSLMKGVFSGLSKENISVAIRGHNALGMKGDVFWGDAKLYMQADTEFVEVNVPGGKWVIALSMKETRGSSINIWLFGVLFLALAIILSAGAMLILRQRDQMQQLAMYDALTGLPNRYLVEDRVNLALSLHRRSPSSVCVILFVDLDRFKSINDQFSHKAGDALLQAVAERLQRAVRQTDTVGRWGGDELIIVLVNSDRARITDLVEQVRQAVETPVEFSGHRLSVGASIGVALSPDDGDTLDALIRVADDNMYADKKRRRSDNR